VFKAVKLKKSSSIRAVGHFETDGTEQGFDALQRPRHRVQAAARFSASGQRDVKRLLGQARIQRGLADRFATLVERIFNRRLGHIDRRACGFLLFRRQLAQAFEKFGDLPALAEETGLHLLQRIGVGNGSERRAGFTNDLIEIVHKIPPKNATNKTHVSVKAHVGVADVKPQSGGRN